MSASVPRLVAGYDHWLVLALVCAIIFVAGLLPALGDDYAQAALGLGIVTLLAFALQPPTGSPAQTVATAFVGVSFVVVLRVPGDQRDGPDADAPDFQRLADWVATSSTNLLRTYTIPTRPQP